MPRIQIAGPPFVPARYGLLSVAAVLTETDTHWRAGVEFGPAFCAAAKSYIDSCPAPDDRVKAIAHGIQWTGAEPFTIYAGIDCSPVGLTEADIEQRASDAMTNGEGRAVEGIFWTGASDNGETLSGRLAEDAPVDLGDVTYPAAEVIGGGPYSPLVGLAKLEEAIGDCYGGRGVIHMDRFTASLLSDGIGAFNVEGSNLVTRLGTYVAAGAGYTGSAPGNEAPTSGTRYMYATGSVVAIRSAVERVGEFRQTINRQTNAMLRLVERTYVIGWDCCLFAVQVEDPT